MAVTINQDTDEAARAELVDLGVGCAVQVQRNIVSLAPGLVRVPEHRRIVSTNLGTTRSVGCSSIEVVKNQTLDGVHAMVDTGRQDVDTEGVLVRRTQA